MRRPSTSFHIFTKNVKDLNLNPLGCKVITRAREMKQNSNNSCTIAC